MEIYERILLNILKESINGRKFKCKKEECVDWKRIFEEAEDHRITSLIYYSIDRKVIQNIDIDILKSVKRRVFISNVIQIKHIKTIEKIIEDLKNRGIEIIVLKGIVLRNYYNKPEIRTMTDADLLIKSEDYNRVKQYLLDSGYCNDGHNTDLHEGFIANRGLEIELHQKIVDNTWIKGYSANFEQRIWNDLAEVMVGNITTNTLCPENFIIHLCIHMAVHIKAHGFGLRQIYDFALFVKCNNEIINWEYVKDYLEYFRVKKFADGIFLLINKLFDIQVPKEFENNKIKKADVDLLLKNIFRSGVHGRKEENEDFVNVCTGRSDYNSRFSKIIKIVRHIFPSRAISVRKYEYVRKSVLLLPISWIERFFRVLKIMHSKKYTFITFIKFIRQSLSLSDKRTEVLKKFDL